jgi:hypothetical protein
MNIKLNAQEFTALCESKGACRNGLQFIAGKSLAEFWQTDHCANWMLWIAGKMVDTDGWWTRQQLVLAACACAETVLEIFEKKYPNDKRPRKAIETAHAWAEGKATIGKVRGAADDACTVPYVYAPAAAAAAAFSVTYPVHASVAANDAAAHAAAVYAAHIATDSPDYAAAYAVAWRIMRAEKLKDLCAIVREHLPMENKK